MHRTTIARKVSLLFFSSGVILVAARARAEEPPGTPARASAETMQPAQASSTPSELVRSRFQIAGRLTYARPFGRMAGGPGGEIGETLGGQVPLTIDLGWRLTPRLLFGGYASFAVGGVSGALQRHCDES